MIDRIDRIESYIYPARLRPDSAGRIVVTFADLPEALTDGADESEALRQAMDCLSEALAQRMKLGEPIPSPRRPKRNELNVAPHPEVAMKIALREAARRSATPAADIARALGVDHKEARRLLDPTHRSKARRMQQALAVFGWQSVTSFFRATAHHAEAGRRSAASVQRVKVRTNARR